MGANVLMDRVADHYDENPEFRSALIWNLPEFEYPNWSHRTVGDVMKEIGKTHLTPWVGAKAVADSLGIEVPLKHQHYSEQVIRSLCEAHGWTPIGDGRVVQKDFGGGLLFAHFDERSRYLTLDRLALGGDMGFKDVVFDMDCRNVDVGVMAAAFNQKADSVYWVKRLEGLIQGSPVKPSEMGNTKDASLRIEAREMAFGDAEGALKLVAIVGTPETKPRLQAMRETVVEVLAPEVVELWAEVDVVDYQFIAHWGDDRRLEDAAISIAVNMGRDAGYKARVIEFAPEVAEAALTAYGLDQERILAKEVRKSAEMTEMQATRWEVFKNEQSGMVGLVDRWDSSASIIEFGGVPAIQAFAKECPEVPGSVINELLGRDGGWDVAMDAFYVNDGKNITLLNGKEAISLSIADSWCEAAQRTILLHSLHDAQVIAFSNGLPSSVVDTEDRLRLLVTAKVVGLTDRHVVMGLGRSALICAQTDLDRDVVKGELVSVVFEGGKGRVSPPAQARVVER